MAGVRELSTADENTAKCSAGHELGREMKHVQKLESRGFCLIMDGLELIRRGL